MNNILYLHGCAFVFPTSGKFPSRACARIMRALFLTTYTILLSYNLLFEK